MYFLAHTHTHTLTRLSSETHTPQQHKDHAVSQDNNPTQAETTRVHRIGLGLAVTGAAPRHLRLPHVSRARSLRAESSASSSTSSTSGWTAEICAEATSS